MNVFGLNWQFNRASRHYNVKLSSGELDRLRALHLWQETGDVKLAWRTFGLSWAALYGRRERFDPNDLSSVKDRSRRPVHLVELDTVDIRPLPGVILKQFTAHATGKPETCGCSW